MKEKPKPYVTIPRYIASDYRNQKITLAEMNLYSWLRSCTPPYGVVTVSLSAIKDDLGLKSENYVNKLLLSLRNKRYLYFPDRRGKKGSFDIDFGDWLLPNGSIKKIDFYFNGDGLNPSDERQNDDEVSQRLDTESQRLDVEKDELMQGHLLDVEPVKVRGDYNDNENDKENNNNDNDSVTKNGKKLIPVSEFKPNSHEEYTCHGIAIDLGEQSMNFLIGTYKKYGIDIIEKAWVIFNEEKRSKKKIANKSAYYNGIIQKLRHTV